MTTKHTPGPWKAEPCYRTGYTVWGGTEATPVCVVDTQDDEGRFGAIKKEADASLIAAAPDLLEALKNYVDGCSLSVDALAVARAAIAKAEGQ